MARQAANLPDNAWPARCAGSHLRGPLALRLLGCLGRWLGADPASVGDGGSAGRSLCPPARLPSLTAIIYGVSPAVIALILHSWWRLVQLGMEDRFQYAIVAVSVVVTLLLPGILTAVFLGAGLLGVGWYSLQARRHAASPRLHDVASFVLLAKMASSSWSPARSRSAAASPWSRCCKRGWWSKDIG